LFLRSKSTSQKISIFIAAFAALTLVVATPVFAASKGSSSKKQSKTTSKTIAKCDRNYSKCVPVASDVDCKPGKGNGPKYTTGPKKVLKKDVYRLDSDKDRIACEKN